MVFKFILLGITLAVIIFGLDVLLPKIKTKYKLHKKAKERKKKRDSFGKKMKELEIK